MRPRPSARCARPGGGSLRHQRRASRRGRLVRKLWRLGFQAVARGGGDRGRRAPAPCSPTPGAARLRDRLGGRPPPRGPTPGCGSSTAPTTPTGRRRRGRRPRALRLRRAAGRGPGGAARRRRAGAGRDATFPMPDGPWPGTGYVVAAVEAGHRVCRRARSASRRPSSSSPRSTGLAPAARWWWAIASTPTWPARAPPGSTRPSCSPVRPPRRPRGADPAPARIAGTLAELCSRREEAHPPQALLRRAIAGCSTRSPATSRAPRGHRPGEAADGRGPAVAPISKVRRVSLGPVDHDQHRGRDGRRLRGHRPPGEVEDFMREQGGQGERRVARDVALIVNPSAGGGRAARALPAVEARLLALGLGAEVRDAQPGARPRARRDAAQRRRGRGHAQRRRAAGRASPERCAPCRARSSACSPAAAATTSRACSGSRSTPRPRAT